MNKDNQTTLEYKPAPPKQLTLEEMIPPEVEFKMERNTSVNQFKAWFFVDGYAKALGYGATMHDAIRDAVAHYRIFGGR